MNSTELILSYEDEATAAAAVSKGRFAVVKDASERRLAEGVDKRSLSLTGVYATPEEAQGAAQKLNQEEGVREIRAPYGHPEIKPYEVEDFVDETSVKFTPGALSLQGSEVVVLPVDTKSK